MRVSARSTPLPIGTGQSYQLTLGFFRFMMFVAILQFGIEGNEIQAIPKLHFRERWFKRRSYRLSERDTNGGWGNLYVAHSGNPWGLSSAIDRHGSSQQSVPLPTRLNYVNNNVTVTKISSINETHRSIHARFRRGVTHLYNMVVCATGCSPLAYKGYGCYCGFLGSGYVMDGIDRCCKMHDWCYEATECPMFLEYFIPYYWKCYRGHKPICAIEHGDWGGSGSCAQRLCECDRSLAECLRRYPCPTTKAVCTSSPWRLIQNLFMIL